MARRYRLKYDTRALQTLTRDVQATFDSLPRQKRGFLRAVGNKGMELIRDQYFTGAIAGKRKPAFYHGSSISTMRLAINVGEKRSYASIIIDSPYWEAMDLGRRAGPVPPEVIKAWAQEKLGLDPDSREVKLILGRIGRYGTRANNVIRNATNPSFPRGRAWSQYIDQQLNTVARAIALFDSSAGDAP